jgi:uncharacterized membrane protein YgcG
MLAGLGVASLVAFAETAGAKPMTCAARQVSCNERCIMNNRYDSQVTNCVRRTCAHQYNNCMNESSGGGGRGDTSAGGGGGGSAGGGGGVSTSGGQKTAGGAVVRDHRGKR